MKTNVDGIEMEVQEEVINGVKCVGFAVVFLTEDGAFLQGEEGGVSAFPTKEIIIKAMEEQRDIILTDFSLREEFEYLHPIIIHCPVHERIEILFPPYIPRARAIIGERMFKVPTYLISREMAIKLKALDLKEDIIASLDLEKQEKEEVL